MKWFYTIIKILFFIPLRIIYPVKVIGKNRLPKKVTYVTISNHLNSRDAVILALYLSGFRYFLAKEELGKNKFFNFLIRMFGGIFIDRDGLGLKGVKASINSLKKAPLSIFPEGTRNRINEDVQEVKGGAAMIAIKAGVDIYPVMIHHKTKVFRRNYILVCPKIELPYTKENRFNTQAFEECTEIISSAMNTSKDLLDNLVSQRTYKIYDKTLKSEYKQKNKQNKDNKQAS